MSLWIDKHRPTTIAKLTYHLEQAQYLKRLVGILFVYIILYSTLKKGILK